MNTSDVIRTAANRPAFFREGHTAFMCHELWAMMNEGKITAREKRRANKAVREAMWYHHTLGKHYECDLGVDSITNAMRRRFWSKYAIFLDQKPCFLSKIFG